MLVRSARRSSRGLRTSFRNYNLPATRVQCRRYSMPTAGASSSSASNAGVIVPLANELDRIAPYFDIKGSQIRIIKTPSDFYGTLKGLIRNAKRRIFLSTLYIGWAEKELITVLQEALRGSPELKLCILTDALRGTREAPEPSCASLLAPLISEFGTDRVEIRMYHTPNLTGYRKKIVPKRINEGWGLQHMKLYGVDDEIILSGANLSTDYFTNRQDRYHLFSSREVTDYFWSLQRGVASFSFLVEPSKNDAAGFSLIWPKSNDAPSPLDEPDRFVKRATIALHKLISPKDEPTVPDKRVFGTVRDTRVYMLAQLSQLAKPDVSTELPVLSHILQTLASPSLAQSSWTFTAGYFNPAPALTNLLLSTASHKNTVIMASPYANGFYKSKGVSGLLPDAYTLLAQRFLRSVHSRNRDDSITLKEWRKGTVGEPEGWTYHAKGLWVTLPGDTNPSISLVGSSNYTKRSYSHDLEAGALILTKDEDLKRRLGEEQNWLQEYAAPITRDDLATNERRVGLKVRIAMWIVQLVGGAL